MSKDLKIQVLLSAVDKLTAPFKNAQKASQQLASALKTNQLETSKLQREYNKNEAQIKKYASSLNPLKAKLSENTASLGKAYAEVRRMEQAMKNMKNPTAAFTAKLDEAKRKVAKLKDEQSKTVAKLKAARAEFKKNGFEAGKMGERQRELRKRIKEANGEIDKQKEKLARLNEKARRQAEYRNKVERLRTKAEQYANIGGRATATYSMMKDKVAMPVSEFMQAEKAATNLKVAMMQKDGTVSADFEKINQLAMQLGDRLPGSTADFQKLMTMLVRQGMSSQTILGGTGEAASYLAVQLEMLPEQAAEFAAKMQDATRTTEADMMGLMDIIQKGFYAGVDPTNMLGAFKNLGSAMDTIKIKGLEGAKVLAPFVAMFDQAGMDGSASGNAMRKVLQKGMNTANVEKQLGKLKKAGKINKGFNLDFTNGKGEFGGFDNMFKQLEKLKHLTTESRLKVIKEIFGDDAEVNQVLSTMIEKGKAGYEEFAEKIERQADLRKRVDEQLGTLTNIWEATTGTFTNLLVEIGAAIAPTLKQLANDLGEVAEKVKNWVKANPQLTGQLMKVAVVITGIVGATGILASAFSFLLFPIGRIVLLFSQLGGVLSFTKVLLFGKTLENGARQAGLLSKAGRLLKAIWQHIPTVFNFVKNVLSSALMVLFNLGKTAITGVIGFVMQLSRAFIAAIPSILSFSAALLTNPLTWIVLGIVAVIAAIVLLVKNWDIVKDALVTGWNWVSEQASQIWNKITQTISEKWSSLKAKVGEITDAIGNFFQEKWNGLIDIAKNFGANMMNKLKDGVLGAFDGVKKTISETVDWIKEKLGFSTDAENKITQVKNNTEQATPNVGFSTGGYTGNGGKYQPKGIVHGGEYVMTKETTSRLGVGLLDRLNYGSKLGATALMGASVAMAQPIKIDTRPPLTAHQAVGFSQPSASPVVNITVNAQAGMNEQQLAQYVARTVSQALRQSEYERRAKARGSYWDKG